MPWITRVGSALRQARLVCGKKGEDAGDVKIPSGPMEDITIALTQTNGKPAGELLVGMKFSHTPGAPPSAKNSYTNEASTWRMLWVVGCGLYGCAVGCTIGCTIGCAVGCTIGCTINVGCV